MRYCPVVLAANGRVKPDLVIVNGQQERHPEGAYYLEWRERGKRMPGYRSGKTQRTPVRDANGRKLSLTL